MFSKKDYSLGAEFLPYLINNDPSGLSDNEIEAFDNWLSAELKELGNPKNHHFTYSTESHFARCDISSLYDECLEVTLLYTRKGQLQFITKPLYIKAIEKQYNY